MSQPLDIWKSLTGLAKNPSLDPSSTFLISKAIERAEKLESLNRLVTNYKVALMAGHEVEFYRKAMWFLVKELT